MTADLDRALEPGETLAFSARGRSFARISATVSFIVVFYCSLHGLINLMDDPHGPITRDFFKVLAMLALFGAAFLGLARRDQRRYPDHTLITDRRLVFVGGGRRSKVETMPLPAIERISWSASMGPKALDVTGAGRTIALPEMRQAEALAGALAAASGKPRPPPLGRMAVVDPRWPGYPAMLFAVTLAAWGLLHGADLLPAPIALSWRHILTTVTILFAALAVSLAVGGGVGNLLTATAMRPFVPPEHMAAALYTANKPDTWQIRLALAWAGLLYGRRLGPIPGRTETGQR